MVGLVGSLMMGVRMGWGKGSDDAVDGDGWLMAGKSLEETGNRGIDAGMVDLEGERKTATTRGCVGGDGGPEENFLRSSVEGR
jgi:hypothetical protein